MGKQRGVAPCGVTMGSAVKGVWEGHRASVRVCVCVVCVGQCVVCVCVGVFLYVWECRCPWRPEALDLHTELERL